MRKIKNIIFDLGSVLLDIDVNRTLESFNKIGVSGEQLTEIYKEPENFFLLFERGAITAEKFRNSFRALTENQVTDERINKAWSAMVIGFPSEKIELLKCLVKRYTIFLLSNTNNIHVPVFAKQFRDVAGGTTFEDIFSKIYYSHEIKLSKPDPAIYHYMINNSGIIPEESLFIDDLRHNVNAAIETGLTAHQLKEDEDLKEILQQYNILC